MAICDFPEAHLQDPSIVGPPYSLPVNHALLLQSLLSPPYVVMIINLFFFYYVTVEAFCSLMLYDWTGKVPFEANLHFKVFLLEKSFYLSKRFFFKFLLEIICVPLKKKVKMQTFT